MTLSTNLPNLHYDKQMFKYPTQAADRAKRRFIFVTNLHYVDAVSVKAGAKRPNSENPRITLALELLLHPNNNRQRYSLSSQHTADSAEKSCRCPLLFSTTPIHDPRLSK